MGHDPRWEYLPRTILIQAREVSRWRRKTQWRWPNFGLWLWQEVNAALFLEENPYAKCQSNVYNRICVGKSFASTTVSSLASFHIFKARSLNILIVMACHGILSCLFQYRQSKRWVRQRNRGWWRVYGSGSRDVRCHRNYRKIFLNWFLSCSHKKPFKCCITPRSEQIKKLIESTLDLWRGLLKSKGVEETPLPFYVNNGDYLNKIFTAYKIKDDLHFSPLSRCQCVRRVWIQKSLPAANNKQPYTAAVAVRQYFFGLSTSNWLRRECPEVDGPFTNDCYWCQ